MRIAIDIRRIQDFGIGTYIRNLVTALGAQDQRNEYFLLGDPERASTTFNLQENFHVLPWGEPGSPWRTHFQLHRLMDGHAIDVLHIPHMAILPVAPCRYVLTVHDVAEFLYGSRHGLRQSLRWRMLRRTMLKARRVLAVSKASQRDIENLFQIPRSRTAIVENAIDERFVQMGRREENLLVLKRYNVTDPFLLYVGSARPQKNIPRLIEAFAVIKGELRDHPAYSRLKLLIIGDELSEHPDLRRTVIRTRVQNDVRFLGFVPIETLRAFYQSAEVFVFPSLHEGFGLPPLEAMAQGTPVVTSNASSLPEVVGDAALLVHPESVFDIARGVEQVLLDSNLRRDLARRGQRQLSRFSWQRSAQSVLNIYAETAA